MPRSPSTRTRSFRQPDHAALADKSAEDPLEAAAKAKGLNYVKLDGSVGIIGNGAGLVMSTLDVVAYAGEEFPGSPKPANFLDIGGGASAEIMANGLEIIIGDDQVKSVFVNVFGGITACDAVANGSCRPSSCWPVATSMSMSHWWCASTATMPSWVGRSWPPRICRVWSRSTRWTVRPAGPPSWRRAEGLGDHGNLSERGLEVIVQGMTGSEGRKHTHRMLSSGTRIVGGVTPGKGGQVVEFERGTAPVFNSVGDAMAATGANVTVIFVPAKFTCQRSLRRSKRVSRSLW